VPISGIRLSDWFHRDADFGIERLAELIAIERAASRALPKVNQPK
jgi:hypothetical protein